MRYRKKAVEVEAWQIGGPEPLPDWLSHSGNVYVYAGVWYVTTLEGVMTASAPDYIIRGVEGELYPCKPEIFEYTYEVVE